MADLSAREPGWYWVRLPGKPRVSDQDKGWRVADWVAPMWELTDGTTYYADQLAEIGPRIYPPGEDREREELVAALRPFAKRADYFDSKLKANGEAWQDGDLYVDDPPSDIYLEQLRVARAALAKAEVATN